MRVRNCGGCQRYVQHVLLLVLLSRTCRAGARHLDALLVGGGGGLVLLLVELVGGGVKSTGGTVGEESLPGTLPLACSLLASLEEVAAAPWTVSAT